MLLLKRKINKYGQVLQSAEYKYFSTLRMVNMVVIIIFALAMLALGIFVHQRIYIAIGQIQTISALQGNLGTESIDFNKLDRVESDWQKKHDTGTLQVTRDPFNQAVSVAQNTTSTTP